MNYHARIMNIPHGVEPSTPLDDKFCNGFRFGHRSARHAAAEVALEADAEVQRLREALTLCVSAYDAPSCGLETQRQVFEAARKALESFK